MEPLHPSSSVMRESSSSDEEVHVTTSSAKSNEKVHTLVHPGKKPAAAIAVPVRRASAPLISWQDAIQSELDGLSLQAVAKKTGSEIRRVPSTAQRSSSSGSPPRSLSQSVKKIDEEGQKEKLRLEHLMTKLTKNEQNIWSSLEICSDSLIHPVTLFTFILQHLAKLDKDHATLFLIFCQKWVEANRGTLWLTSVVPILQTIAGQLGSHESAQVKKYAELLSKALTASTPVTPTTTPTSSPKPQCDFFQLLLKIRDGSLKMPYDECVKKVAKDLFIHEVNELNKITAHHFIKKWPKEAVNPLSEYIAGFDRLSFFLVDIFFRLQTEELAKESEYQKCSKVIGFYLDLAESSLALHNYASACCIAIVIFNSALSRLSEVWKLLTKSQTQTAERLNLLFSGIGNYKVLRSELKELQTNHTKNIAMYLKDLTAIFENNPSIAEDGLFNYDKLFKATKIVKESLHLLPPSDPNYVYFCNLFGSCMASFPSFNENDRYDRSLQIQPSSRSSSVSSSPSPKTTPRDN